MFSPRIVKIRPSAILTINAKAAEMRRNGLDVINFSAGEPDYSTSACAKGAASFAIQKNFTKYTPTSGIPELKETVKKKFKRDNNISYEIENIMCGAGAKQILYNAFQVLLRHGEEVILGAPYWVSYVEMIRLAGGKEITIDTTKNHFRLTASAISEKITKKTKIILLNSPANPTGAIIPKEELDLIARLAVKNNLYVISDEVYEYFIYDDKKVFSIARLRESIWKRTITVNSVSKTFSMTGWRLGYCGGPAEIIQLMTNLQDHSTSCPCSISQWAAEAVLNDPPKVVKEMILDFKKRRDYVYEEINKIPGFYLEKPEGAFYAFIKVSDYYGDRFKNSFDFCEFLLNEAKVALVPGGAFGKEGDPFVRLSFATSMENLEAGIMRIRKSLGNHST